MAPAIFPSWSRPQTFQPFIVNRIDNIGPEIYEPLFKDVLEGEVFDLWQQKDTRWQLRCYGGPGSGKVCALTYSLGQLFLISKSS